MDDMNNKAGMITVGDTKLLVGNAWESEVKHKGVVLNLSLRAKAQSAGAHFVAKFSPIEGQTLTQFCLADLSDVHGDVLSGDIVVAKHIKSWIDKDSHETAIFIKSIQHEEALREPRYWMVAVNKDGTIAQSSKGIFRDRFSLEEAISLFSITNENFSLVTLESDGSARLFIDDTGQKFGVGDVVAATTITDEQFQLAITKEKGNASFSRIYRPSQIKAKRVIIGVAIAIGCLVGAGLYSYVSQMGARNYFSNEEIVDRAQQQRNAYQKKINELKTSTSKWDDKGFRQVTLEQFTNDIESNLFSPIEVAAVLREINLSMPPFSAEWRLAKITYEKNRFFVRYERIDGGKGVYFFLDKNIDAINKGNNKLHIDPVKLIDEGKTRIYAVTPSITLPLQDRLAKMKSTLREEARINTLLSRSLKIGVDSANKLSGLFSDHENLSFKQRWILLDGKSLLPEAEEAEHQLSQAHKDVTKLLEQADKFTPLTLDDGLIIGNVMDFVSIMQMDSLYSWSFPVLNKIYPDTQTLNKRNEDAKKKNKKSTGGEKQSILYGPAIESYRVEITSLAKEEEEKTKSYGMGDLIQLALLINKPFVNVDLVEYDSITEQWMFSIHFHRRTSEYIQRIAPLNNKEVKL